MRFDRRFTTTSRSPSFLLTTSLFGRNVAPFDAQPEYMSGAGVCRTHRPAPRSVLSERARSPAMEKRAIEQPDGHRDGYGAEDDEHERLAPPAPPIKGGAQAVEGEPRRHDRGQGLQPIR